MSDTVAQPPNPSSGEAASAIGTVADRVMIQAGHSDARGVSVMLSGQDSGLVVTGAQALGVAGRIHRDRRSLVLGVDLEVEKSWIAEADKPFHLGEAHLFGEPSLEASLDDQRQAGASFALTPTGHIRPGDSDSLKAAVEQANQLKRDDVILRLPCDASWVTRQYGKQLNAVIGHSRHPVALSLAHEQDPLGRAGAAELLWEFAATHRHLILWRTDMAALAHISNGGLAASVGFSPTLRHGVRPGKSGFQIDVSDRTPRVLLPDFLSYLRGSRIERIYAATPPPRCHCVVCNGKPLDRFDETTGSKFEAQAHGVAVLRQMIASMSRVRPSERPAWWGRAVTLALQSHVEATAATRVTITPTRALKAWAKLPIPTV